jgi:hypothetical protein
MADSRTIRQLAQQARTGSPRTRARSLFALATVVAPTSGGDDVIGADGAKALAKLALDAAIQDGTRKTAGGAAQVRHQGVVAQALLLVLFRERARAIFCVSAPFSFPGVLATHRCIRPPPPRSSWSR